MPKYTGISKFSRALSRTSMLCDGVAHTVLHLPFLPSVKCIAYSRASSYLDSFTPLTILYQNTLIVAVVGQAHSVLHLRSSRHLVFIIFKRVKRGVKWEKFYYSGPVQRLLALYLLSRLILMIFAHCYYVTPTKGEGFKL